MTAKTKIQIKGNQRAQHEFLADTAPGWVLFEAGLGAGKTWAAARKFLMLHAYNKCPGLIVAPTGGDLFRFAVPEIISACNEWGWEFVLNPNGKGDRPYAHFIIWDQVIYLISAEDPKRFAGFEVGHIWVDEGSRCKQNHEDPLRDSPTQIGTRLRHPDAKILQAIISTTPEGTDTWVQDRWHDNPRPNHRSYRGSTLKNKNLPQGYIDDLKSSLPANLLDQYLHGIAADLTVGIAHPTFCQENIKEQDWLNTTVHIGMDFNVSPLCWVAGQVIGDSLHIVDELFIEDFALVDDGMEAIKAKGWGDYPVEFHPDKASKQRSTTGDSEWLTIESKANEFGWDWNGYADGVNPPINQRINLFSRMICDALGKRRLTIHPRCERLIEDLKRTTRKKTGGYDPGSKGKRGHILDAASYMVWDTFGPEQNAIIGKL